MQSPMAEVLLTRLALAGWREASVPREGREFLAVEREGSLAILLDGQGATAADVKGALGRWSASSWSQVNLLWLFPSPMPRGLEHTIRRASRAAVRSGFLDFADGQAWIRPGPGQGSLRAALRGREVPPEQQRAEDLLDDLAGATPRGTYALMGLCLAMFLWAQASGGTEDLPTLLRFGANYGPLTVGGGEWWRLVGATFMHIGWMHVAMNMYSLWVVGPILERFMGTLRFLAMYAVAGLGGSLASVAFGTGNLSAGASGAIFGVFGATALLGWRWRDSIPTGIRRQLLGGMVPTILFNLFVGSTIPGIDNRAHLGGLVAGMAFTALVPPRIAMPRLPAWAVPLVGALALAPFAVQAWVAYLAWSSTPYTSPTTVTWSVPGTRYAIRHSPLFEAETRDGKTWLSAPLMLMEVHVSEVDSEAALRGQLAQELGAPLEDLQAAGRTWHVGRATTPTGDSAWLGATFRNGQAVILGVVSPLDHADLARQVLQATAGTLMGP